MDYIERLIRRAIAFPRQEAQGLFDPFEQVAPLEPDSPRHRVAAMADATAVSHTDALPSLPAIPPRSPVQAEHGLERMPEFREIAAFADKPEPEASVREDIKASQSAVRTHKLGAEPLAQADAFMRSMGIKVTESDVPARRGAGPLESSTQTSPRAAASKRVAAPAMVRPIPPEAAHPAVPVAPQPAPRGYDSPSTPMRRQRGSAPQPEVLVPSPASGAAPAAPVAERIVQTKVVVTSRSGRLDDLARSSGISRFGIGQH